MSLQKFKTIEEAREALYCFEPDEEYFERVRKFFELASKLVINREEPGIHKFRSFQEFNEYKEKLRITTINKEPHPNPPRRGGNM
ncbi:MAG: hypothetical protein HW421_1097 [Ignavibacteria bacterium]|nr:hypothetical protein [Ignavibacteria bacterium]